MTHTFPIKKGRGSFEKSQQYHCKDSLENEFTYSWDPANIFHPATFSMYAPVPSQEPVIQWLFFVYV